MTKQLSAEYQAAVNCGALTKEDAMREQYGTIPEPIKIEFDTPAPKTITHSLLMQRQFAPVVWGINELCPQGVVLMAAKPKIGKSWLALQMCWAKASGRELWDGRDPESKGEALYLALEDNERRLQKRALRSFPERYREGGSTTTKLDGLHFATEWPRMGEGGFEALDLWLEDHPKCDLVAIDTVARIRPGKSGRDDYADDYAVGARLKVLADRHKICILLIHHTRKQEAVDPFDMVSGTQGLTGSVDATLVLTRERGQGKAGLFVTGRDIENEVEMAIEFDGIDCLWKSSNKSVAELRMDESRQQIVDAVRQLAKPSTIKAIKTQLGEDGIHPKAETLRKTVQRMVKADQLSKDSNLYELSQVSHYG